MRKLLIASVLTVASIAVGANEVLWEMRASGRSIVARDTTYIVCQSPGNTASTIAERKCWAGLTGTPVTPEQFAASRGYNRIERIGLLREGGGWFWIIEVVVPSK